ncbi:MAG: hypothetical protein M1833_000978 [Piccolia ochrophora]|nr:MAG: hypothetical protein M1833_000978 [Piccolia ochrophora]
MFALLRHRAPSQVPKRRPTHSLPAIWITDEILADGYEAFARACSLPLPPCARHGSSVPGPLEARRRLAKRRMTSVPSIEGASLDPGGLWEAVAGSIEGRWTWEPPTPTSRRQEGYKQVLLPPLPPEPDQASESAQLSQDRVELARKPGLLARPSNRPKLDVLCEDLAKADNLAAVRALMGTFSHPVDGVDIASMTNVVMARIALFDAPSAEKLAFASELAMSHPETQQLGDVLKMYAEPPTQGKSHVTVDHLIRSIPYGMMRSRHVRMLVLLVRDIADRTSGGGIEFEETNVDLLHALWQVIESNLVSTWQSAEGETVKALLNAIKILRPTDKAASLAAAVITKIPASQFESLESEISALFMQWMLLCPTRDQAPLQNQPSPIAVNHPLLSLLDRLPLNLVCFVVTDTVEMVRRSQQSRRHIPQETLACWAMTITSTSSIRELIISDQDLELIESYLAVPWEVRRVASYLRTSSAEKTCRFVLTHWVPQRSASTRGEYSASEDGLQRYLYSLTLHKSNFETYMDCIYALLQLQIPFMDSLRNLFDLLNETQRPAMVVQVITELCRQGIHVPKEIFYHEIDRISKVNILLAEKLFQTQCSIGVDGSTAESCGPILHALRTESNTSPTRIINMLRCLGVDPSVHPRSRHRAYHSSCEAYNSQQSEGQRRGFRAHNNLSTRSATVLLDLLTYLVSSPQVKPRVAYRWAYWCYRYVEYHGSPSGATFSRALLHGGATLWLEDEKRVSLVRLRYILDHVRDKEGLAVADVVESAVLDPEESKKGMDPATAD